MAQKYLVGNINDYQESRGWISGSFFPKEILNHDENVEIKIERLDSSITIKKHHHTRRKSWVLVIEGEIQFLVDDQEVNLKSGDFLIMDPGVTEEVTKSSPGTTIVSVHSPSGAVDKIED